MLHSCRISLTSVTSPSDGAVSMNRFPASAVSPLSSASQ